MEEVDMIRLQLKLQGSVSVKVSVTQSWDAHGQWNLVQKWCPLEFFDKEYERHFSGFDTIQHLYLNL